MMLLAEEQVIRTPRSPISLAEIGVIILTFNAEEEWSRLKTSLDRQGLNPNQILIVDSTSTDNTYVLAQQAGYALMRIPQIAFNHGGTRRLACEYFPDAPVLLFLTQDAIPAEDHSLTTLCSAFADPSVGAAYGRQLPRLEADAIERHARLFNYPPHSESRTLASRQELGIKAAFFSNSFAAYRQTALEAVGGFPTDVILAEDTVVAARLLLADWRVAYVAEATVFHSHGFTAAREFARYFDIGVHHARQSWLLEEFGSASGEGRRFVLSELRYLRRTAGRALPRALARTGLKWVAYQLGLWEQYLPLRLKRRLSSCTNFWQISA